MTVALSINNEKMPADSEGSDSKARSVTGVLVYVAVVVTLGLCLCVALLVTQHRQPDAGEHIHPEDEDTSVETYDVTLQGVEETIDIDIAHNKEIFKTSYNGEPVIVVMDFNRSIAAIFTEESDACYLMGGLDSRLSRPRDLLTTLQTGQLNQTSGHEMELYYLVAPDYPVTDHSLLPHELQEPCRDKQIFWLKQEETSPVSRRKRSVAAPYSCSCSCSCGCAGISVYA